MAVSYDISKFIEAVELYSSVPVDQGQYTNANIAKFLNDAQLIDVVPLIEDVNEEYFVTTEYYDIVGGQSRYKIPSNAIGGAIRQVETYSLSDTTGTSFQEVPRVTLDQISRAYNREFYGTTVYYIENNDIVLYPTPQNSQSTLGLRVKFFRRPLRLAELNNGALVTSVSGTTVSLSSMPTNFVTGMQLDVVENRQPFNVVASPTIVGIAGLNITVDDATGISVNDGVAEEGYSIIPNLPAVEDHLALETAGVIRFLMALDDDAAMQTAQKMFLQQAEALRRLHSPRDRGSRKKTIPNRAIWRSTRGGGNAWGS